MVCKTCGKASEPGSRYCEACGAGLPQLVFCGQCGSAMGMDCAICSSCGAAVGPPAFPQPSFPPAAQKKGRRGLVLGICAAAGAVLIAILVWLAFPKETVPAQYGLYLKDGELFYRDVAQEEPIQITQNLCQGDDPSAYLLNSYVKISRDGSRIFYPDRMETADASSYSLYTRRLDEPEAEGEKIDANVHKYAINETATLVTYTRGGNQGGSGSELCQSDLTDREKLASDLMDSRFYVSDDGKQIVYVNTDGTIYHQTPGGDRERMGNIDPEWDSFLHVTQDRTTVFYHFDGALYQKQVGGDRVKLAEDVNRVLFAYDTGEVYFLSNTSEDRPMMDYVVDDMAQTDAAMTEPIPPTAPSRETYDSQGAYDAAVRAYETIYDTEYRLQLADYWSREERYALREELKENTYPDSKIKLCFYDGQTVSVLSEYFDDYGLTSFCFGEERPVLVFRTYQPPRPASVKLSEIGSCDDLSDRLGEMEPEFPRSQYVAVGGTVTEVPDVRSPYMGVDLTGSFLFYFSPTEGEMDLLDPDASYFMDMIQMSFELYHAQITDGAPKPLTLYDEDVSLYAKGLMVSKSTIRNGAFVYFKDMIAVGDRGHITGSLYWEGKHIADDVSVTRGVTVSHQGDLLYYTDWDRDREQGTLWRYGADGAQKISDDVRSHQVTGDGEVLYLYDYSTRLGTGDLYRYQKDGKQRLDSDVSLLLDPSNNTNLAF